MKVLGEEARAGTKTPGIRSRHDFSPAAQESSLQRAQACLYPPPTAAEAPFAQVAQLVEHATENRSVGGSIPSLGTTHFLAFAKIGAPFFRRRAPHVRPGDLTRRDEALAQGVDGGATMMADRFTRRSCHAAVLFAMAVLRAI